MGSSSYKDKYFIDNIIALCYIIDDLEEFNKRLLSFLKSKDNRPNVMSLCKVADGESPICLRKIKTFYHENKEVIDKINKYGNLFLFICNNYDKEGNLKNDNFIVPFYNYFMKNKEKIDSIISLLEKIKLLGFESIIFNEEYDFTDIIYKMSSNFNDEHNIVYLDNMEKHPDSEDDTIRYCTDDTNFKIVLRRNRFISIYRREIWLNSLLFDKDRLPKKVTEKEMFDEIVSLEENNIKKRILK